MGSLAKFLRSRKAEAQQHTLAVSKTKSENNFCSLTSNFHLNRQFTHSSNIRFSDAKYSDKRHGRYMTKITCQNCLA